MKGYIAITSVILISVVLAMLGTAIAFSSYVTRSTTLSETHKQQSNLAAYACIEQALLNLALNSNYTGNENLTVPGTTYTCSIQTITASGSNKTITSQATVQGSTTRLELVVVAADLAKVSLKEL